MKACRGSRGIAPLILNVNTKWRRLGGSQSRSQQTAEEKNPFNLPGIEVQTIQPVRVTISTMLPWVPKFVYVGESLWSQCNT
jgi:hypothetical protein